jgi:hypothetical protein
LKNLYILILLLFLFSSFSFATIINIPADQPTIQAGINASANGDTVLVQPGIYVENINFNGKNIVLGSLFLTVGDTSYISNTIIDGSQPSHPDSGSVVSFVSGEDSTSILSGFTLTNGTGTITQYTWDNNVIPIRAGGGVFCYNSGARISFNKIINNHIPDYSESDGGGIAGYPNGSDAFIIIEDNQIAYNTVTGDYAWTSAVGINCNGTIKNNDISHNTNDATINVNGAGGCWSESSFPRFVLIKNNRITHNVASGNSKGFGGGLIIEGGMSALVVGNEITYNELNAPVESKGAGLLVINTTGNTVIDRNTISNNRLYGSKATGGGICLYNNKSSSNSLITNNIISGNSALEGGGIHGASSISQIINNTIVNNTASYFGGGIRSSVTKPVVINSILWNNQSASGPQISGSIVAAFSNIQDSVWVGVNNISTDPIFADTLFQLSHSSPCIGTGIESIELDGTIYYCPPIDRDSLARPYLLADEFVDMGALESKYQLISVVLPTQNSPQNYALKQNYPNPFNPTTTIEYTLPRSGNVSIIIYDMLGRKIKTLVNMNQTAAQYQTLWDGTDDHNNPVATGVYFYKMETGDFADVNKLVLVR